MKTFTHQIIALCAVAMMAGAPLPAAAQANADFASAVQTFNSGQYPQAADMFTQYLRQQPNDALGHYYLAVTWHCLGRAQEAATEYNWVLRSSPDPELQKRAQMGITVVSRTVASQQPAVPQAYQPQYPQQQPYQPYQQQQAYPQQQPYQQQQAYQQQAYQQPQQMAATLPPNIGQQGRIIDLYTQWCGWCKRFEPIFMQAKAKYGTALQFDRIDAEAPGNDKLVKKYKVRGYPTILLLDNNGNVRKRIDGAPQSLQDFETTIFAAYPVLRSY